ncbi:HAMP domain-containing protein, partial [Demequina iriomotensis]|uniref:HAMP domain-containing protein n=1 Tax=Demequina iriomotensis TaxID=1536641 RepID=UPI000A8A831B
MSIRPHERRAHRRFTLASRLSATFGGQILLVLLLGAVAVTQLTSQGEDDAATMQTYADLEAKVGVADNAVWEARHFGAVMALLPEQALPGALETEQALFDAANTALEDFAASFEAAYGEPIVTDEEALGAWRQFQEQLLTAYAGGAGAASLDGEALNALGDQAQLAVQALTAQVDAKGETELAAARSASQRAKVTILAIVALAVAASALIGVIITRRITRSVGQVKRSIDAMADGDLTVAVVVASSDEIGDMAHSLTRAQES